MYNSVKKNAGTVSDEMVAFYIEMNCLKTLYRILYRRYAYLWASESGEITELERSDSLIFFCCGLLLFV
jgi:hypothetical protein